MKPTVLVDLSHPLVEPLPCYPGDTGFKMSLMCCSPVVNASAGNTKETKSDARTVIRTHTLSLGTHTGTHVDAPFHFFPSGQKLHEIPLDQFVGRAIVLDIRHLARDRARIGWADIARGGEVAALSRIGSRADGKGDIVLLWTGWDVHWGTPTYFEHPYFARDVATALCDLGAKIVGVDVLNPDETPADGVGETVDGWGVHEELLGRGVVICENLKSIGELVGGNAGEEVWVGLMPLSLHDADGAPVRAYGWKQRFG